MYGPGQEVMRCQPFVYAIKSNYRHRVCDWCLQLYNDGKVKACAACKYVCYCSKLCQKKAWKSHHKFECKMTLCFTNHEIELQMIGERVHNWPHAPLHMTQDKKYSVLSKIYFVHHYVNLELNSSIYSIYRPGQPK